MLVKSQQKGGIVRGPVYCTRFHDEQATQPPLTPNKYNSRSLLYCPAYTGSTVPQQAPMPTETKTEFWLGEYCLGDGDCPSLYGDPDIRY
jgi:hypothetical protein